MKSLDAWVVRGKEKQICDLMMRLARGEIVRADLCDSEASAGERRKEAIVEGAQECGARTQCTSKSGSGVEGDVEFVG
jgi:hypothetical protein